MDPWTRSDFLSTTSSTSTRLRQLISRRSWTRNLRAAHQAGLRDVRLIHGRGIGVQRARVQQVLRGHPLVTSFADAPESHLGATVVRLKTGSG